MLNVEFLISPHSTLNIQNSKLENHGKESSCDIKDR